MTTVVLSCLFAGNIAGRSSDLPAFLCSTVRAGQKKGGTQMKLKVRYENEIQIVELSNEDADKLWVSLSLTGENLSAAEKEQLIQKAWDEHYNKPEYNNWHKETRHIDHKPMAKKLNGKTGYVLPSQSDNSMENLLITSDANLLRNMEYEDLCELIRRVTKPKYADMIIRIVLDGISREEYANEIDDKYDNVVKRFRRAIKFLKTSFFTSSQGYPIEGHTSE